MMQGGNAISTLDDWMTAACADLGIDPRLADQRAILDLARQVAHQVDRPAAPLTAFLLGVAVGRGQQMRPTAERLLALASVWERPGDDSTSMRLPAAHAPRPARQRAPLATWTAKAHAPRRLRTVRSCL